MWYLAFISFLLLGGYLLLMALRFGIPNMVSDTYYQLQGCTGSEIAPFKQPRNMGLRDFINFSAEKRDCQS